MIPPIVLLAAAAAVLSAAACRAPAPAAEFAGVYTSPYSPSDFPGWMSVLQLSPDGTFELRLDPDEVLFAGEWKVRDGQVRLGVQVVEGDRVIPPFELITHTERGEILICHPCNSLWFRRVR